VYELNWKYIGQNISTSVFKYTKVFTILFLAHFRPLLKWTIFLRQLEKYWKLTRAYDNTVKSSKDCSHLSYALLKIVIRNYFLSQSTKTSIIQPTMYFKEGQKKIVLSEYITSHAVDMKKEAEFCLTLYVEKWLFEIGDLLLNFKYLFERNFQQTTFCKINKMK
jgi:hypothetical protein